MYIELMTVRGICAGYDGMPEDNVMKVSVRKKKKKVEIQKSGLS